MMNWGTFWAAGAAQNSARAANAARDTAREARRQRMALEEQTEIMRKSMLSPEQIAAEENAKSLRHGIWIVFFCVLFFVGACFAYPIFGIIVGVGLTIFLIVYFARRKKRTEKAIQKRQQKVKEAEVQRKAYKENQREKKQQITPSKNTTTTKTATKKVVVTSQDIRKQLDKLLDLSLKGLISDKEYESKARILKQKLKIVTENEKSNRLKSNSHR